MLGSTYRLSFFVMAGFQAVFLIYFTILLYSNKISRPTGVLAKRDLYSSSNDEDVKTIEKDRERRFQQHFKELNDSGFQTSNTAYRSTRGSEDAGRNGKTVLGESADIDRTKDIANRPHLFVAILSASNYTDRRNAVRESWMQECDPERRVICKFFTDGLDERGDPIKQELLDRLKDESAKNRNDLIILDTPSGINFSLRLLALMEWAKKNVEFDFLLRIDDDYFLCLDRLIEELPQRPKKRLYWGYLHCFEGITRIDEGMMILTADLVYEFLRDKDKLMCHKFGDQAVAMWIYESMKTKPVTWFGDIRIHHDPPASYISNFKRREEICHTFLSLHGSYPADMGKFQEIAEHERRHRGSVYEVPQVIDTCPYERDHFSWNIMQGLYFTKPMPCRDEPTWVHSSTYKGRQSSNATFYS